ncbi:MAG: hypothetical protein ACQSGP_10195, partial [Frankia sp.]
MSRGDVQVRPRPAVPVRPGGELEPVAVIRARPPLPRPDRAVRQLRLRRQVTPLVVVGGLWAAGAGLVRAPAAVSWAVPGYVTVMVLVWLVRGRQRTVPGSRERRRARRHLYLVVAGGAGWLGTAPAGGVWGWRAAALWVGGYALAGPSWYRHRIPIPPIEGPPPPPAAPEPVADGDWVEEAWAEIVAPKDGSLPGSWLTGRGQIPTGATWDLQVQRGKQTTLSAVAAAPLIASALGLALDRVTIDRPTGGEMDRARLLITDRESNPLRQLHPYPGAGRALDPTTGRALIGVHADLDPAWWQVFDREGARRGLVIGSSNAGKSLLMELLGLSCMWSGRVLNWVIDGGDGDSLPRLSAHADWATADPTEALRILRAASALITIRGVINKAWRRPKHPITPAAPMVNVIIDECHEVMKIPEAAALAERLGRRGRKAGVGLTMGTQYPDADACGGVALRDALASSNLVALRLANNAVGGMVPGLTQLDLTALPDVPGLGYTAGQQRRVAPFRGFYEGSAVIDELMAAAPPCVLEPAALQGLAAVGGDYQGRHDRQRESDADLLDTLTDWDPDMVRALAATSPAMAAALDHARTRPRRAPAPDPASRTTPTGTVLAAATALPDIPAAPMFGAPPPTATPTPPADTPPEQPRLRTPAARAGRPAIRGGL